MDIGKARTYLLFEQLVPQTDDGGGQGTKYEEVGRAFGQITPMGAFERIRASRSEMEVSHWIRLRNCGFKITNAMRIRILQTDDVPAPQYVLGDRVFAIEGVTDPDERGWEYKLLVSEAPGRN